MKIFIGLVSVVAGTSVECLAEDAACNAGDGDDIALLGLRASVKRHEASNSKLAAEKVDYFTRMGTDAVCTDADGTDWNNGGNANELDKGRSSAASEKLLTLTDCSDKCTARLFDKEGGCGGFVYWASNPKGKAECRLYHSCVGTIAKKGSEYRDSVAYKADDALTEKRWCKAATGKGDFGGYCRKQGFSGPTDCFGINIPGTAAIQFRGHNGGECDFYRLSGAAPKDCPPGYHAGKGNDTTAYTTKPVEKESYNIFCMLLQEQEPNEPEELCLNKCYAAHDTPWNTKCTRDDNCLGCPECKEMCQDQCYAAHSTPWNKKCAYVKDPWDGSRPDNPCKACPECKEFCQDECTDAEHSDIPWEEKCAYVKDPWDSSRLDNPCKACKQCNYECQDQCYSAHDTDWEKKCAYVEDPWVSGRPDNPCKACPECQESCQSQCYAAWSTPWEKKCALVEDPWNGDRPDYPCKACPECQDLD